MVLVDSGVWIDAFRGANTSATRRLRQLLEGPDVAVGDLILTEVLQGFDSQRDFDAAHEGLRRLPMVRIAGARAAVMAARNYRLLRSRGVTVRKTIDTLIATRCLMDGLELLYIDRDFDPFVEHLGLRSAI